MKCDYLLCFILFQRTLCLVSLDFILSVFLFPDPTVDPDADFYYGKEKIKNKSYNYLIVILARYNSKVHI